VSVGGLAVPVAGGTLAAWRLGAGEAGGVDADWDDAPDAAAPADIPDGPAPGPDPVIAIHGITATSRSWLAVARALDGRAELVAPDLRGRGASRAVGPPFGLDAHAADIVALLDHLGLARAVIAGHSLGAFVACRLAVSHPERVARLVLVDGGLPLPGAAEVTDPEAAIAQSLGPVVERLHTEYRDRETYRAWWAAHPAFAGSDVDPALLDAYADYDACGEPPRLRSSVVADVVPADGREVLLAADAAALDAEAVHLHAPRGFFDDPHPLQPADEVAAWARSDPRRRAVAVPGVNHYTIVMGERGARVVADEILAALAPDDGGPALA
jgi:pimeloyl-ACP methyl ester carboxylesterase